MINSKNVESVQRIVVAVIKNSTTKHFIIDKSETPVQSPVREDNFSTIDNDGETQDAKARGERLIVPEFTIFNGQLKEVVWPEG